MQASHSHVKSKKNISKNDQLNILFHDRSDHHSSASRLQNQENINKYENITKIISVIYSLFFLCDEAAWDMQQHQQQIQCQWFYQQHQSTHIQLIYEMKLLHIDKSSWKVSELSQTIWDFL